MNDRQVALALSGGGIRAMIFHLGVLRHLAENGALETISRVSTVSGGSLLLGLVFKECDYVWPRSDQFLSQVYPALREQLCAKSLQWGAARQLVHPGNWRYFLSRSNLLAKALRHEWGVTAKLSRLPEAPEWSINGTTAETGKRFRFKRDSLGDYMLGYSAPGDFPLADALAVSAAFPGGFGPLSFEAARFQWKKRPAWGAPVDSAVNVEVGYRRLHLYDGGIYDNLGLEPFFDAGRGVPKPEVDFILVSDAGAPLRSGFPRFSINPWRLKRVADITSDQSRALRVRGFMSYIGQNSDKGAYVYIGMPAEAAHRIEGAEPAGFPTTLRRVTGAQFDCIAGHGQAVASQSLAADSLGFHRD
ncbi:patatin-like phospholipase family protein [Sulfuritalea hydrogenivorans]|uniref:Patatin n=1 Tax=Sulfuritalea hydrogenivorans sk43H TaxID=1223802 RepID=W0SF96_9PROT|nr:patatin-like phospholipase family protein [Sulfuritalea hydrogenivorans]BAO29637.1 patatin [Sulfuritalea hydrogenivorans sk43H]